MNRRAVFVLSLLVVTAALDALPARAIQRLSPYRVLVFSKTAGFRHVSIESGIEALAALGAAHNFAVDATEDASAFTDANLARYEVVVFLSTTGDVLDDEQQDAFRRFIQSGGGFVGIHAAADTEYGWNWYGGLVGARFASHPAIQTATLIVADRQHPSTRSLPERWVRNDEWYNFQSNPRGDVHVLATLDESTYPGGTQGQDHPIAWCHVYDGGRAWYTAGGHTSESFAEPLYLEHLYGGIACAAGAVECDCSATASSSFQKVILDHQAADPMNLTVAPDGRVFYVERRGTLKLYRPATNDTVVAGTLDVFAENEDGLVGVAVDSDFDTNGFLYLYYSPAGPAPIQRLSRFIVVGDTLDMASETTLLEIPTQRELCCHTAGDLVFDAHGNLFISTGDNTSPIGSRGFSPVDDRPGHALEDAQRTSANSNDLRGKILRITPSPDGSYAIPPGNLFPPDGSMGRPEIYVMAARNPFRMAVDRQRDWLYWGDIGPDTCNTRLGLDEFNQTRVAGNYGWPYCIGDNEPFPEFDFDTLDVLGYFDCDRPVNQSPNNTGLSSLPPAEPAWIWYPYGPTSRFPQMGNDTSRAAMAGDVYHFDPALDSDRKLPAYFDDTLFVFDWAQKWIKEIKVDANGSVLAINPFIPDIPLASPIDMEIGPDGAFYLLEWGSRFFGSNVDAQLVRIDYVHGQRAPIAVAGASPFSGALPLTVNFSSAGSFDPDFGDVPTMEWDFDADGTVDSTAAAPTFVYHVAGNYDARLTVRDSGGLYSRAVVPISAGNAAPTIVIAEPPEGGMFDFGDRIAYRVAVVDPEDGDTASGSIDCARVHVDTLLGHDTHGHPEDGLTGCTGFVTTGAAEWHVPGTDLSYILEASYTDNGAAPVAPLTGRASVVIRPKHHEAEHYTTNSGTTAQPTADVEGCSELTGIDHGDYVSFATLNLANIDAVTYRVSSLQYNDARIDIRVAAPDGPLVSSAVVPRTGDWGLWTQITAPVVDPGGTHELFFVFVRNAGDSDLFRLNWIEFGGRGIGIPCDVDDDGDGVVTCADVCPGTPTGVNVDAVGCRAGAPCTTDADCDDGYACTSDVCGPNDRCTHTPGSPGGCDVRLAVDCGAAGGEPTFVDGDGREWLTDRPYAGFAVPRFGYLGGHSEQCEPPIGAGPDAPLYQNTRTGFTEYRFDVPTGFYAVGLRLADTCATGPGQRVMDIRIQGQHVLQSLDLVGAFGRRYAVDYSFLAWVGDGLLSVTASASAGEPTLSAISVISTKPELNAPAPPPQFEAIGSLGRVLLSWGRSIDGDVAGYLVERSAQRDGPFAIIVSDVLRVRRFSDRALVVGQAAFYRVSAVDLWGNRGPPTEVQAAAPVAKQGDVNADGSVSLGDMRSLAGCITGSWETSHFDLPAISCIGAYDGDADNDIDLRDFADIQIAFDQGG